MIRNPNVFSLALAAGLLATAAGAQDLYLFPGTPVGIPDASGPCDTCSAGDELVLMVAVPDSGIIQDVDLHLDVSHTWYGDLVVRVTHPDGTLVEVKANTPGAGDSSDLMGLYVVDDEAATTWDDAALACAGSLCVIPPGAYKGSNPLSAFDGKDRKGTWTLTICDTCGADVGSLAAAALGIRSIPMETKTYGANPFPGGPLPIPDGVAANVCTPGNELVHSIAVPDKGCIFDLNVTLDVSHTWYGDLDVTVTSPAGTSLLIKDGLPDDSSNLLGPYVLDDEGTSGSWDAAATACVGSACVIPPGTYTVDVPLSAFDGENLFGTWTVTICDTFPADLGTLNGAELEVTFVPEPATRYGPSLLDAPFENLAPGILVHAIEVPDSGIITDLDVSLNLAHTWVGDVEILLVHPDGLTSAFLTDGTPDDSSNLMGIYTFDDEAAGTLDAAATATSGSNAIIPPGSYVGDTPLSVFDGLDKQGLWTIEITDLAPGDPGNLFGALAIATNGGTVSYGDSFPTPVSYDNASMSFPISISDSGTISDVDLELGLGHTWLGDLDVSVTHPDGTVVVLTDGTPDDSSDLVGIYRFDDEAGTTFDAAAAAAGAALAPGAFVGDNPLSTFDGKDKQGVWTVTIADTFAADIATVFGAALLFTDDTGAGVERFGTGCPGTGGLSPKVTWSCGPASIGNPFFRIGVADGVPGGIGFLNFGLEFPAGFGIGAGCSGYLDPFSAIYVSSTMPVLSASGTASIGIPIPADPVLVGGEIAFQWSVSDGGAPLGFTLSDAVNIEVQP